MREVPWTTDGVGGGEPGRLDMPGIAKGFPFLALLLLFLRDNLTELLCQRRRDDRGTSTFSSVAADGQRRALRAEHRSGT
eukprot:gene38446-32396_t